jgi:hypothetical protein
LITIPTTDLTGVLKDTIPFAWPDDDQPTINAIRVSWDGEQAHAMATDGFRIAVSSYHPDDPPLTDTQDEVTTAWGGADDPWSVNLPLVDAAHLIKVFKLPAKHGQVPVQVDHIDGRLKIIRARGTGHPAIAVTVDGQMDVFPDLRAQLSSMDGLEPVGGISFTPSFIADFAKVRPRGPLELTFTGQKSLAHIAIGARFVGAIMPVRPGWETN